MIIASAVVYVNNMQEFSLKQNNNIWYGSFELFEQYKILTACSCRMHGLSSVAEGTLNLALHVDDNQQYVLANRQAFADAIGVDADRFTTCQQVHGNKVAIVDESLVSSGAKDFADTIAGTDALITDLKNVPLLLFYADCVPVLLADIKTGCIGLAHAGWRGSVAEITVQTVQQMIDVFNCRPEQIIAGIGPSIGSCCYEVDDFVYQQASAYHECFTSHGDGKYHLDLWKMNEMQLVNCGILPEHIAVAGVCTNHNKELFCSYRAENGKTGRMGVCICRK